MASVKSSKTVDFTRMSVDGQPPIRKEVTESSRWWECRTDEQIAQGITGTLNTLAQNKAKWDHQVLVNARLYGNLSLQSFPGFRYSKLATARPGGKDRLTFNVVQSCVDTVTAKIAKLRPKPCFLTSGGDFKQKRRAKKLGTFMDGVFYANNYQRVSVEVFRDAAVFGTGVIHVFNRNGEVAFERVLASELSVDELEAMYGEPRQLHRVKAVDRQILVEQFPELAKQIGSESEVKPLNSRPSVSDMLTVRESWHLPSGPDAKDGRHVISLEDQVLFQEEYDRDCFPFAFVHWNRHMLGFWGQGLAEQLQGIQLEINKLLWVAQRSLQLQGSFKILLENSSKIVSEHFTNDVGAQIRYSGTKPEYILPPAVPPEIYAQIERLKQSAYEQSGISQLSAQSQKPAGLPSGKALRELNDIESDRFEDVGQRFQQLSLDVAKLAIDTIKEITGGRRSYRVNAPGKKFLETIDWKDVCLKDDQYVMKLFPVSSLPDDPAGRLQTIQEYIQAGFYTPAEGRRLLDYPDMEASESLANASIDYLEKILDAMVDDGDYTPPEEYDDLQAAREMALQYYQLGKAWDLEEERLEMLRRFMSQLDDLTNPQNQDQEQAPAGAPGAAPGGPPQAQAAAPPVSDLMPFKGGAAA